MAYIETTFIEGNTGATLDAACGSNTLPENALQTSPPADRIVTGSITGTESLAINTQGACTCIFWSTGSWTGWVDFEYTSDGTNWLTLYGLFLNGVPGAYGDNISNIQNNPTFGVIFQCAGYMQIRAKGDDTTPISGSVSVTLTASVASQLQATTVSNTLTTVSEVGVGNPPVSNVTEIGAQDVDGVMHWLLSSRGQLLVGIGLTTYNPFTGSPGAISPIASGQNGEIAVSGAEPVGTPVSSLNPVLIGVQDNNGYLQAPLVDANQNLHVVPYRRSQVVSQVTPIVLSAAVTTVLPASGDAAIYDDLTMISVVTNTLGAAGTITLSDGTNTYVFALSAAGSGFTIPFTPALSAANPNVGWTAQLSSALDSVTVTVVAVQQQAS